MPKRENECGLKQTVAVIGSLRSVNAGGGAEKVIIMNQRMMR